MQQVTEGEYDAIVSRAQDAFLHWRTVPAPRRGELVRQIGDRLREVKAELGALVTLEMGKIRAEGEGEVLCKAVHRVGEEQLRDRPGRDVRSDPLHHWVR